MAGWPHTGFSARVRYDNLIAASICLISRRVAHQFLAAAAAAAAAVSASGASILTLTLCQPTRVAQRLSPQPTDIIVIISSTANFRCISIYVHRVSKKNKQNCFCQNFVNFDNFWRKDGQDDKLMRSTHFPHHLICVNALQPHIILSSWPSLRQKLSKLVEI